MRTRPARARRRGGQLDAARRAGRLDEVPTYSGAGPAGTRGASAGAVIELSHVSKTCAPRFGRPVRALDDVSFRVAAGEVAGLSGPAGAGKSALIALVLGHGKPTSGSVRVDGVEPRRFVEREGI